MEFKVFVSRNLDKYGKLTKHNKHLIKRVNEDWIIDIRRTSSKSFANFITSKQNAPTPDYNGYVVMEVPDEVVSELAIIKLCQNK